MTPTVLNRAALVLAFAGVFIAGTLSLGHILNVSLPCGPAGGCDAVTTHASSRWGGIPVAYFGLAAYAVLLGLAAARAFRPNAKLILPAYLIAAVGTLASVYLQYVSLVQIRQICPWCMASAAVMALSLIVHALLYNAAGGEKWESPKGMLDTGLVAGLFFASAVGLGVQSMNLLRGPKLTLKVDVTKAENASKVLPQGDLNVYGPATAKVTVVEFADLFCPGCRDSMGKMRSLVDDSKGNVRWVFRHFPLLSLHEDAFAMAVVSEIAAEKGNFFPLLGAISALEQGTGRTLQDLRPIANQYGVDDATIDRRISDENDPAFKRAYRDFADANSLGLGATPTYFVIVEGQPPRPFSGAAFAAYVDSPEFKRLIGVDGP